MKELIDNLPIMYDVLGKVKGPNGIIHPATDGGIRSENGIYLLVRD